MPWNNFTAAMSQSSLGTQQFVICNYNDCLHSMDIQTKEENKQKNKEDAQVRKKKNPKGL